MTSPSPIRSSGSSFGTPSHRACPAAAHSIKLQTWFFDGADNDVVRVCVNGTTCVDTGSWEDYFRLEEPREPDPVDSVLFHTRTSGGAWWPAPGNGFFIDNFQLKTQNYNGANLKLAGPSQAPRATLAPVSPPTPSRSARPCPSR